MQLWPGPWQECSDRHRIYDVLVEWLTREVGLYSPAPGQRLLACNRHGRRLPNHAAIPAVYP